MFAASLLFLRTAAAAITDSSENGCQDSVSAFVSNDPSDLNDADLAIAQHRLLPHYRRKCPTESDRLSEFDARLDGELSVRMQRSTIRTWKVERRDTRA